MRANWLTSSSVPARSADHVLVITFVTYSAARGNWTSDNDNGRFHKEDDKYTLCMELRRESGDHSPCLRRRRAGRRIVVCQRGRRQFGTGHSARVFQPQIPCRSIGDILSVLPSLCACLIRRRCPVHAALHGMPPKPRGRNTRNQETSGVLGKWDADSVDPAPAPSGFRLFYA